MIFVFKKIAYIVTKNDDHRRRVVKAFNFSDSKEFIYITISNFIYLLISNNTVPRLN